MSDRRTAPPPGELAAIVSHLRQRGPLPGCQHIFDRLLELDRAFPGLSLRNFILAIAIASAEGEA
jgi:hypothetical protein